jgi:DNA-binding NtrC family response regulator
MRAYPWRGNVRELRNVIERAVLLRRGDCIYPADLLFDSAQEPSPAAAPPPASQRQPQPDQRLDTVIDAHIRRVLRRMGGNKTQAALQLGISLSTLKRRLKRISAKGSK